MKGYHAGRNCANLVEPASAEFPVALHVPGLALPLSFKSLFHCVNLVSEHGGKARACPYIEVILNQHAACMWPHLLIAHFHKLQYDGRKADGRAPQGGLAV